MIYITNDIDPDKTARRLSEQSDQGQHRLLLCSEWHQFDEVAVKKKIFVRNIERWVAYDLVRYGSGFYS